MARSKEIRNVLIIRLSALGDVAMTIPVVYSICDTNPEKRFVLITRGAAAQLFVNAPKNLTVKAIDFNNYKGIAGLSRLVTELQHKYDFDVVADLHNVLRTRIIDFFMSLKGVKVKYINKGRSGKRALTRRNRKVMLPLVTSRARYREVFYRLGITRQDTFETLYGGAKAPISEFDSFVAPHRPDERWIAIAPFAKHKGKIYPLDLMKQVVDEFANRQGYRLFLFGAGERECEIIATMSRNHSNIVNMAQLGIGIARELALLSHCDVMISMDSANMHMASLVALPVVSIWGATHPYCGFLGWRQKKANAVQLDMVCRPCSVFGNKPCFRGDYHCLRGIQPQFVIDRTDKLLNRVCPPQQSMPESES